MDNTKFGEDHKGLDNLQRIADSFLKKLENSEVRHAMTKVLRRNMNPQATSLFNDLLNEWSLEACGTNMEKNDILSKLSKLNPETNTLESVPKKESPKSEVAMETSEPSLPKELETLEAKLERMERSDRGLTESNDDNPRKGKKRGPDLHWDQMMSAVGAEPFGEGEFQASKVVKISSTKTDVVSIGTSPRSVYQSPSSSRNVSPWGSDCKREEEMASSAFSLRQMRENDCQQSLTSSGYIAGSESNSDSNSVEVNSMENDLQVPKDFLSIFRDFAISKINSGKEESVPEKKEQMETLECQESSESSSTASNQETLESQESSESTSTASNQNEFPVMESNAEDYGLIPPKVHGKNLNFLNKFVKPSFIPTKRDYDDVTSSNEQRSMSSKKQKLTYDHWIPDHTVSSVKCTPQKVTWDRVMRETGTSPISPNYRNFASNLVFNKPTNAALLMKRKRPLSDNP